MKYPHDPPSPMTAEADHFPNRSDADLQPLVKAASLNATLARHGYTHQPSNNSRMPYARDILKDEVITRF